MLILTSKMIAKISMKPGFSVDSVTRLCRNGKLYGFRKDELFAPWQIPVDSFALYLQYNPILKISFLEMTMKEGEEEMNIIYRTIRDFLNKDSDNTDESYTIQQLIDIFGYPENQIKTMLCDVSNVPFGIALLEKYRKRYSAIQILKVLSANPEQLEKLKDRHQMLLADGDYREGMVRHLLMLHTYYKSNGYLI